VNAREEPYLRINQALEKAGVSIAAQLQVPHYVAVPYIVAQSDLLVTVPQKLAERAAAPFGLCYANRRCSCRICPVICSGTAATSLIRQPVAAATDCGNLYRAVMH
jgi:hypothetical protein